MTKRSDYQRTSCQNHIQEKNVGVKKAFKPAWIFVNPPLVILANCSAHQFLFRVTWAAAWTLRRPCTDSHPPVGVRGVGAAGGTAQGCHTGDILSSLGAVERKEMLRIARPGLGPARPGTWPRALHCLCWHCGERTGCRRFSQWSMFMF